MSLNPELIIFKSNIKEFFNLNLLVQNFQIKKKLNILY